MIYYGGNDYRDCISHHGILGQKWGVQNGPPYPIGYGGHSKSEQKAGWRKSLSAKHTTRTVTKTTASGSKSFKLKTREMSPEEDLKCVNPGLKLFNAGKRKNCMMCTAAYELRRRGYDVKANVSNHGFGSDVYKKWFPKSKCTGIGVDPKIVAEIVHTRMRFGGTPPKNPLVDGVKNTIIKQGDGARGNLMLRFIGAGGHSMAYEVSKGELLIRDAQIAYTYRGKDVDEIIADSHYAEIVRLDNVDFDAKNIKAAVT